MNPILHGPNGELIQNGQVVPEMSEAFRAAADIFLDRLRMARQIGQSFNGARDFYEIFGYDRQITTRQYRELYQRGGVAGKIVDLFPQATWRGEEPFEVLEDEDPNKEYTQFEQAWLDLSTRLQVPSKFQRVDRLAGLSTYAVLLIGTSVSGDLEQPLPRGTNQSQIIYLTPYSGGGSAGSSRSQAVAVDADAMIETWVEDTSDPRFGLPLTYRLKRTDINAPQLQRPVHWTRIIHVAEGLLDDDVNGIPTLERVWNLLMDLEKVTGGGAEAFFLRANQGLHLDVDKDMALDAAKDTIASLKEQAESYKHQLTRWLRTRGVDVQTLGSDVADFLNPADAILTQIAGAKGIPKRILTGSEMGELASSQDRENWRDQVIGRQTTYAGPTIVRQTVDRLVQNGYLPAPKKGPNAYKVSWPHIQVRTEQEKIDGAKGLAAVNQTYGDIVFTDSEIRDQVGFDALTDEQKAEIEAKKQADQQAQAEANAAAAERLRQQNPNQQTGKVLPFNRAAEDADEMQRVLAEAIECGSTEVVQAIIKAIGGQS